MYWQLKSRCRKQIEYWTMSCVQTDELLAWPQVRVCVRKRAMSSFQGVYGGSSCNMTWRCVW